MNKYYTLYARDINLDALLKELEGLETEQVKNLKEAIQDAKKRNAEPGIEKYHNPEKESEFSNNT